MEKIRNEKIVILLLITILIISSGYIFKDYLYIMLVSTILALATSSLDSTILKKLVFTSKKYKIKFLCKYKELISSTILSIGFLLLIFFPLIYFITSLYKTIAPFIEINTMKILMTQGIEYLKNLPEQISFLQYYVDMGLNSFNIKDINPDIAKKTFVSLGSILNGLNGVIIEVILIITFYFIINLYGKLIKTFIFSLLPLSITSKDRLYIEFSSTSSVVLYSIVFTMFAQGIAFGILMMFYDYSSLYTGLMAGFLSVIPIVGTALVYLPIVGMEIIDGNIIGAIIILTYSLIFMGFVIDNIFKIIFIQYINKEFEFSYSLSELLMLLSMMAAIGVMGFWGVIVGPAILALTFASLNIYKDLIINNKKSMDSLVK